MVGLLIINRTLWLLFLFAIILQLLRTLHIYPLTSAKELSYQSAFCPFRCNPFNTDCVISPLLCVPKRNSVELRVVHDLSFPEGSSVNDGIRSDQYLEIFFKLRLPGIDRLVEFVNAKGRGCHVLKKDLLRAYR